ncbi:hypothetical protein B2G71_18120 [Novosphingobium sp. PC22D]|uniref:aspartyl/asparaginyl beta-hydroxylase domain-containing protein n=1 Tax=Novosphingobium sp. PC22D TaxID=1962403 RepID=UPI000BEF2A82|nr:aspartyl/asparaginyl beta-hydroxylase domain-containing protein [Novosphingobium sp. PC22D]PEQ11206.1 hypothetical protein B2G71_18120 [Novosphingobium sp. PC22D]
MTLTANQAAQLREDAQRALQRRDGRAALAALDQLPDAPELTRAQAHLMLGDLAGGEAAIDRLLAAEPRNIWGLIIKGDCRAQQSDSRAATAFFKAALDAAARLPSRTPDLETALGRVQQRLASLANRFEDDLRARLAEAGVGESGASPRIAEALDILTGRREVFFQQPQSFFYPGLPQIQFYEREQFDWIAELESRTAAIRGELEAVLAQDGETFRPYVESDPSRPAKQNAMVGDPRWGAYYLWKAGKPVAEHAVECPATMAALERPPVPVIAGRSPLALFSMLRPGMHISPHTGFLNTRLICHLPLIAPPGCTLRVGNETRAWDEGRALIFDDSIEHEAWNRSDQTRVVLLFEIWRPEIGEADRAALTVMFEYISAYAH